MIITNANIRMCKCNSCHYQWIPIVDVPKKCPSCGHTQWNGTPRVTLSECIVDGCTSKPIGHDYCCKHYQRWRKHGDVHTVLDKNGELLATREKRFWQQVQIGNDQECWEWQGKRELRMGYGEIRVFGISKAHRIAYFLATKKRPTLCVLHKCDNPPCCNPSHLYEGTQADNKRDCVERNRHIKGERHHLARLTDETARYAYKQLHQFGRDPIDIADELGVAPGTIGHVARGETWMHVTKELSKEFTDTSLYKGRHGAKRKRGRGDDFESREA